MDRCIFKAISENGESHFRFEILLKQRFKAFSCLGLKAKRFGLTLVVAINFYMAMLQPASALYENARWTELNNGMRLVVIENHRAPVIHAKLVFRVGSDDERENQAGLAHFLEHMMFRGSHTLAPGEFDRTMSGIGAEHNATTSKTATTYFATFASEHLETWMKLEADRMTAIMLLPEEVESERGVVLTEKLQEYDANPQRLWGTKISKQWQGEMAARPVIGRQELLETFTPAQLREFFDDWYKPNNAALIISGDVSLPQAKELAEKYFGDFEVGPLPPRQVYLGKFNAESDHFDMVDERVTTDQGRILTWMPPVDELGWTEEEVLRLRYAAFVLAELVSGELRAPLDKALIVEQKVAQWVSFGIFLGDEQSGATASIEPAPNVDISVALEALEKALPTAIDRSLDEERLARAKRRFVRSAIYANDSVYGPANSFARLFVIEDPLERNLEFEQRVKAVTLQDVRDVVTLYRASNQKFSTSLRRDPGK